MARQFARFPNRQPFRGKTITDVCREALTKWVDKDHPIILLPDEQPDKK